ncbi:MAG: hypothetical protein K1X95_07840 [Acidimicrobiia bacterium]|nr:hypothetical protein [Acidimicrobiia bacterium]
MGQPEVRDLTCQVPGPGMPPGLRLSRANNNLDVVDHAGRLYLAFRSAIFHFASPRTWLHVVSSGDGGVTWRHETTVHMGRDMREPRLLSWDAKLFLYFFEAGRNPFAFVPGRVFVVVCHRDGTWTEPVPITTAGYVPWRTKVVDGVPYMMRYYGGEAIYSPSSDPIDVEWLTTDDGYEWTPVDAEHPYVYRGGASETDFAFTDSGDLVAVARNEAGDGNGWGSLVCRGPAGDRADWTCRADPRKFDSPFVFTQDGRVYLIARRQVAFGGRYDLGLRRLPRPAQTVVYELAYWATRKRTSLWEVDADSSTVSWVLDLPSRGDTAFAGGVRLDARRWLIFNYSSDVDGADRAWLSGQLRPTRIYSQVLAF